MIASLICALTVTRTPAEVGLHKDSAASKCELDIPSAAHKDTIECWFQRNWRRAGAVRGRTSCAVPSWSSSRSATWSRTAREQPPSTGASSSSSRSCTRRRTWVSRPLFLLMCVVGLNFRTCLTFKAVYSYHAPKSEEWSALCWLATLRTNWWQRCVHVLTVWIAYVEF